MPRELLDLPAGDRERDLGSIGGRKRPPLTASDRLDLLLYGDETIGEAPLVLMPRLHERRIRLGRCGSSIPGLVVPGAALCRHCSQS